jgi:PHD/YefM family antitoxin component YafN of YafNO toxin-antitoxin module
MIKLDDIHSLTAFQRDARAHVKQLKKTGRPAVLPINGKAALVVQDASAYQSLLDLIERAEAIAGIQKGLDSAGRGEGEPAAQVFARLRKKHNMAAE